LIRGKGVDTKEEGLKRGKRCWEEGRRVEKRGGGRERGRRG
jgi:hypothetical protein